MLKNISVLLRLKEIKREMPPKAHVAAGGIDID